MEIKISMEEIDARDLVLTGTGQYEPVLLFAERGVTVNATYIRVQYVLFHEVHSLLLSPGHRLAITVSGHVFYPMAAELKIGEKVLVRTAANTSFAEVSIIGLNHETHRGAYVPLTYSGTIVVNNVIASCYAQVPHWQAHFLSFPLRLFARYVPLDLFRHHGKSYFAFYARVWVATLGWIWNLPDLSSTPTGYAAAAAAQM